MDGKYGYALPDFKRTTLYRLLVDIGFVYERMKKGASLLKGMILFVGGIII